jgi:hypothetical protein
MRSLGGSSTGLSLWGFGLARTKPCRLKPALPKRPPSGRTLQSSAIKSISTRTFLGRRATSTVERAGACVEK